MNCGAFPSPHISSVEREGKMKVRARKKFEKWFDKELKVYHKEGEIFEVTEARGNHLMKHGMVDIVPEDLAEPVVTDETFDKMEDVAEKVMSVPKKRGRPKK